MSTLPSRESAFATAPLTDLFNILLKQFKRPLAKADVDLTTADVEHVAGLLANRQMLDERTREIREGLARVVEQSNTWFTAHDLTFEESLKTEMGDMPGWETTGEFLDLANEKSNAELRVSNASALLVAMGAEDHADVLRFLVENPQLDDVSAVVARRVLAYVDLS